MMKKVIVPIFVPHMGCPHACVFCNQYRITGQWQPPSAATLAEKVKAWRVSSDTVPGLAFYGGSFTAIDLDVQNSLLESAVTLKKKGAISEIRLSTRPDALDDAVLARLKYYGVDTVEIGVQSLCDEVLQAAGRGHTAETAIEAIKRVKVHGFQCGAQMMVALPKDTPARSIETCRNVIDCAPDFVRIYPTAVIRDTALETMYQNGSYVPWAFEDVIDTVAEMVELLNRAAIPVIRIGLQAEDRLSGGDVVAGAYHPALGEHIKARLFRRRMEARLDENETAPIIFAVAPRMVSQARGQHRANIAYLEARTGQSVTIIADDALHEQEIERR